MTDKCLKKSIDRQKNRENQLTDNIYIFPKYYWLTNYLEKKTNYVRGTIYHKIDKNIEKQIWVQINRTKHLF